MRAAPPPPPWTKSLVELRDASGQLVKYECWQAAQRPPDPYKIHFTYPYMPETPETPEQQSPRYYYEQARNALRRVDYSQLSVAEIMALHGLNDKGSPYNTAADACAALPLHTRFPGLQVQVGAPGCYLWWPTTDLSDEALVPIVELASEPEATDADLVPKTPKAPELPHPEEPDYLTPYDVYTSAAVKGLLAGRHSAPHDTVALAAAASAIGAALVRQRADYFRQFPVGTLPSLEATEL